MFGQARHANPAPWGQHYLEDEVEVGGLRAGHHCPCEREVVGTPPYMSPKLHAHQPYRLDGDLWAPAVTIWEVTTNQHPFPPAPFNQFTTNRNSPPHLVRQLAQQATQARAFQRLPRKQMTMFVEM